MLVVPKCFLSWEKRYGDNISVKPKGCTGGAMIYVNVHDDVPSFWVTQAVNRQTSQAKSLKSHSSHTPFLHLPFS